MVSWTRVTHQTREAPLQHYCSLQLGHLGKFLNPSLGNMVQRRQRCQIPLRELESLPKVTMFQLVPASRTLQYEHKSLHIRTELSLPCRQLYHQHHPWHT